MLNHFIVIKDGRMPSPVVHFSKKRRQFAIVLATPPPPLRSCPSSGAFHHTDASNVPFKSQGCRETDLYLAATDTAEACWGFAYTAVTAAIKSEPPGALSAGGSDK